MSMRARMSPLAGLRLLVVEDETLIAMMLEDMLADLGITVVGPVGSVPAALALVAAEGDALDGAVLDVNLGTAKAYPIADALTARGVPAVFLTGYGPAGIDARYSGVPVLTKPVEATRLERVLEQQHATRGARR